MLKPVRLVIQGRDTEQRDITVTFEYPIWTLAPEQAKWNNDKIGLAQQFIMTTLFGIPNLSMDESTLRTEAFNQSPRISEYAFKAALTELERFGRVERRQDRSRQGNWKRVHISDPTKILFTLSPG